MHNEEDRRLTTTRGSSSTLRTDDPTQWPPKLGCGVYGEQRFQALFSHGDDDGDGEAVWLGCR